MGPPTRLVVLPGTRQTELTLLPTFVKPASDPPNLQRTIKAVLNAKKIAVVVGAGISTAANIPDFRSSTGLFASLKARFPNAKLTSGRDLFDVNAWKDPDTLSLHLGMLAELHKMCGAAEPTAFHQFLKQLDNEGRLSRVYTQNIDGLEEKAGLSYGIPDHTDIYNSSSSSSRSRPEPPSTPKKRNLKRKRDQGVSAQLPPTPRSTPPPSSHPEQHKSDGENLKVEIDNSQRAHSESSSSQQSDLSSLPPSSQLSSLNTVCPDTPMGKSKTRALSSCESAAEHPVSSRPIRSKPVDPFPRVIPLHGTLKNLSCLTCKHSVLMSDYIGVLAEGETVECPQCQLFEDARAVSGFRTRGVGLLKSGVVLYGEEHNDGDRVGAVTSRDLMRGRRPDLLIVAGTSLKVPGTKRLVKELGKVIKPPLKTSSDSDEDEDTEETTAPTTSCKKPPPIHTIFLNNEFPSPCGFWKDTFDVWVKGNVDSFIELVEQEKKNQEGLKHKRAQEKLERERKKEEKLRRTESSSQLTLSAEQPESVEAETSKPKPAIKNDTATQPSTPSKPRKLILKVSPPSPKKKPQTSKSAKGSVAGFFKTGKATVSCSEPAPGNKTIQTAKPAIKKSEPRASAARAEKSKPKTGRNAAEKNRRGAAIKT